MATGLLVSNRVDEPVAGGHDPIAIVGIGCRFPGIDSIDSFWRVLRDGIETVGEYPGGRLDLLDSVYSGTRVATGRGGFLRDLKGFDAEFFGISSREAELLDPQQRLLLETSWEALEDAGIPAEKLAGSQAGVFVGVWTSDYEACARDLSSEADFFATTGTGRYSASGRLAYFLDLRGPALTVDTACSSSLVAIHMACRSLRSGESELALAGGVNVILRPDITLAYSAAGMLAPDGRSKFGDAAANGYVRSEGAGILVLKPLACALADGDPIHALIRGSAVNNDGRSSGQMISPSREGQDAVLRAAFADAGVRSDHIDYIEAHGTGTAIGDPVEIETIGRVMASGTRTRPCAIGSVKTNIGHTESAAGVAGVIKTAMALQRSMLPASLHFQRPNPAIPWNQLPLAMQTKITTWPQGTERRIAGVSGFGITGTNAHVVLEAAVFPPRTAENSPTCSRLYVLSAHTPEALRAVAESWRARLSGDPSWPASMADLAFTAGTRRTHHDSRLAVTALDRADLESRLAAWLREEPAAGVASGLSPRAARRIVFVFPGQGGQWIGMGRALLREDRVFREAVEKCDLAIRQHAGWSVVERLLSSEDDGVFSGVDIVQPALFAVMIGLAALWRSWGIEPDAVVGHSMGESAAAAVSGALTLEDAAAVICHRSLLMKGASGRGRMAVVNLSFEEATQLSAMYNGRFSVAASNSRNSTVISGEADAIEDAVVDLEAREVLCRRIKVDVASHSAHMEPFREELARRLKGIKPRAGTIPLYSTTTGAIENGAALDADYWARNLREPVRFSAAVQQLLADGFETFLEINAHPVLVQAIEEGGRQANKAIVALACLHRDQDEHTALLDAAGALFVNGFRLNLGWLYPRGACLALPAYPWQRERHWLDGDSAPASGAALSAKSAPEPISCLDDIFELQWIRENPPSDRSAPRRCWLAVGEHALVDRITAQMEEFGEECIRATNADEVQHALQSLGALCGGVIYVSRPGMEPEEVIRDTYDALRLVQALASVGESASPRLWLLTSGSYRLPGDSAELSVAGSPAWGLARVVSREYPELRSVNVDLSPAPSAEELQTLVRLLRHSGSEEQLAVRGTDCWVARYERNTAVHATELSMLRPDATYLLTGGMGGIGLKLGRWLTLRGARHIALLGRRAPSDTAREDIAAIESLGASVRIFSADISEESQVASALDTIADEMPPLRGVFHLSMVTDWALLADLTEERLRRVMLPKASGAWNLHRLLEHTDLDFFILFSSIAAAFSQPGFGNYAAANAFVDSLARYRQAKGLPAQSIQWCPWTKVGLATTERAQRGVQLYRDQGVIPVSPEAAFDALGRMILLDRAVLLVMPAQWPRFAGSFEGHPIPSAFLSLAGPSVETATRPVESIREKLGKVADGPSRRRLLETHLRDAAAHVLKTAASRVELTKSLGSMGVNSLMALELVRRLSATTGVRVPATAVFNYPTIVLLSEEIARRMGIPLDGETIAEVPVTPAPTSGPAVAMAEVSEDEAVAALMGKNGNTE